MRSNILMIVVIIGLIGCTDAKGGGDKTTTPSNIKYRTITPETKVKNTVKSYDDYKPVEMQLDDMTFSDAFRIQHSAKGEGHTFWWNGDEYTTDLYISLPVGNYKWVKNNNDIDDTCTSNVIDECGVCDGHGKDTWYIDLDGDGLGDPNVHTTTCTYPSVDEE